LLQVIGLRLDHRLVCADIDVEALRLVAEEDTDQFLLVIGRFLKTFTTLASKSAGISCFMTSGVFDAGRPDR
jgi:hypothetical protein